MRKIEQNGSVHVVVVVTLVLDCRIFGIEKWGRESPIVNLRNRDSSLVILLTLDFIGIKTCALTTCIFRQKSINCNLISNNP